MTHPRASTPAAAEPRTSCSLDPLADLLAARIVDPPSRPGVRACLQDMEILDVVGIGGMAVVLLARHPEFPRPVVVKLLKPALAKNATAVRRFHREAAHMQSLDHPHILPVLRVSSPSEYPYFATPYVDRGSLARQLSDPPPQWNHDSILSVARDVASALAFAHKQGIVHRDVKPDNVLLDANGRALVADFGLGQPVLGDTLSDLTRSRIEGTPQYMSYGVARGEFEDGRRDIYGFGAMLYEMLTGRPPYDGADPQDVVRQILAGPPPPISNLNPTAPRGLVSIAEGAMARELRDRYAEMDDVLEDLNRVACGQQPIGPRLPAGRRWPLRLVLWLAMLFCSAVALYLATAASKWQSPDSLRCLDGTEETNAVPAEVLFAEDFREAGPGLPTGWNYRLGAWRRDDGVLVFEAPDRYRPAIAWAPHADWRDYRVECLLCVDQAGAGILFRHAGDASTMTNRYYAFNIRLEEKTEDGRFHNYPMLQFTREETWKDAESPHGFCYRADVLAQKELTVSRGEYHRVRVEVVGWTMTAFLDGVSVLRYEDREQTNPAGGIGIIVFDQCFRPGMASVKDLRVTRLGSLEGAAGRTRPALGHQLRPIAAWEFSEGSGAETRNVLGSGEPARLHGGCVWISNDAGDGAIRLNGKDALVTVADHPLHSGMRQLALHVRFQLHSPPADRVALVMKQGPREDDDDSYRLDFLGGRLHFQISDGTRLTCTSLETDVLPLDCWIEAVATYDGLHTRMHVRQQGLPWRDFESFLLPTQVQHVLPSAVSFPLRIGCDRAEERFLHATIDWIRIYAGPANSDDDGQLRSCG